MAKCMSQNKVRQTAFSILAALSISISGNSSVVFATDHANASTGTYRDRALLAGFPFRKKKNADDESPKAKSTAKDESGDSNSDKSENSKSKNSKSENSNSGNSNSGNSNSGNSNSGSSNSGSSNSESSNSESSNSENENSGSRKSENDNSGSGKSENDNSGSSKSEHGNLEDSNMNGESSGTKHGANRKTHEATSGGSKRKSNGKPKPKPTDRVKSKSEDQSSSKSEDQSKGNSEDKPKGKSEDQSKSNSEDKPKGNSEDQSKSNSEDKPKGKSEYQSKGKSEDQPKVKPENQSKNKKNETGAGKAPRTIKPKSRPADEKRSKQKSAPSAGSKVENLSTTSSGTKNYQTDSALLSLLNGLGGLLKDPAELSKLSDDNQKLVISMAADVLSKSLEGKDYGSRIDKNTIAGSGMNAEAWASGNVNVSSECRGSVAAVWAKRENGLLNVTIAGTCRDTMAPSGKRVGEYVVIVNARSAIQKNSDLPNRSNENYWSIKLSSINVEADCCTTGEGSDKKVDESASIPREIRELTNHATIVLQSIVTERQHSAANLIASSTLSPGVGTVNAQRYDQDGSTSASSVTRESTSNLTIKPDFSQQMTVKRELKDQAKATHEAQKEQNKSDKLAQKSQGKVSRESDKEKEKSTKDAQKEQDKANRDAEKDREKTEKIALKQKERADREAETERERSQKDAEKQKSKSDQQAERERAKADKEHEKNLRDAQKDREVLDRAAEKQREQDYERRASEDVKTRREQEKIEAQRDKGHVADEKNQRMDSKKLSKNAPPMNREDMILAEAARQADADRAEAADVRNSNVGWNAGSNSNSSYASGNASGNASGSVSGTFANNVNARYDNAQNVNELGAVKTSRDDMILAEAARQAEEDQREAERRDAADMRTSYGEQVAPSVNIGGQSTSLRPTLSSNGTRANSLSSNMPNSEHELASPRLFAATGKNDAAGYGWEMHPKYKGYAPLETEDQNDGPPLPGATTAVGQNDGLPLPGATTAVGQNDGPPLPGATTAAGQNDGALVPAATSPGQSDGSPVPVVNSAPAQFVASTAAPSEQSAPLPVAITNSSGSEQPVRIANLSLQQTAAGSVIPIGASSTSNPSVNMKLVVPQRSNPGNQITVSVVDEFNNAANGIEVIFNGSKLTTNASGQVTFLIPEDTQPGSSLSVSLSSAAENSMQIDVIQPVKAESALAAPTVNRASYMVSPDRVVVLDGHNFNGVAELNRVLIDGATQAKVLAASPIQLRIAVPDILLPGTHYAIVGEDSKKSNPGKFDILK